MKFYNPILHGSMRAWADQDKRFKGGGGGGGTSTTSNQLDPTVAPFVKYGLEEAQGLYKSASPEYYAGKTYVEPSAATTTALSEAEARAKAGNPLLPAAQGEQYDVISGKYLAPNPYLAAAMKPTIETATMSYNDAVKQALSDASKSGRYGSNVMADLTTRAGTTLANTLANKGAELAYGNYASERARQEAAAANAPALSAADYADIQQLANVGKTREDYAQTALQSEIDRFNFEQNKPYQKLAAYLGAAYGAPMGQVSTTTSQQKSGKIVCTMMNESYGFGSFRQSIWLKHSAEMPNAKVYEKGYHTLFLPLVSFAKGNGILNRAVKSVIEHIARHRTSDIYLQMKGKRRDTLGRIYRAILEPICYIVGRI